MAKEKVVREFKELSKDLQLVVGALFDKRVQLSEIEKELKISKDDNTEKFLDVIYDQLKIDGIKRVVGEFCQSVGIVDRGPSIDKEMTLASLKRYFGSKIKDKNEAMMTAEAVAKELEKSKEERLRDLLVLQHVTPADIMKIIPECQKETKLTVSLRITKSKKKFG